MHHIFCSRPSVEGHFSCSPVSAIARNAAVNTGACVFSQTDVLKLLGEVFRRGVLGHRVTLASRPEEPPWCLSPAAAAPARTLTSGEGGPFSCTASPTPGRPVLGMTAMLTGVRGISCGADLRFPNASEVEQVSCTCWLLDVFLGEVSVQALCPFLNWVVCLFGVELFEFFTHFGHQLLVSAAVRKYLLIRLVASLLCWRFPLLYRTSSVCSSPTHLVLPLLLCLWGQIRKVFSKTKVQKFSTYVFFCVTYCFSSLI